MGYITTLCSMNSKGLCFAAISLRYGLRLYPDLLILLCFPLFIPFPTALPGMCHNPALLYSLPYPSYSLTETTEKKSILTPGSSLICKSLLLYSFVDLHKWICSLICGTVIWLLYDWQWNGSLMTERNSKQVVHVLVRLLWVIVVSVWKMTLITHVVVWTLLHFNEVFFFFFFGTYVQTIGLLVK